MQNENQMIKVICVKIFQKSNSIVVKGVRKKVKVMYEKSSINSLWNGFFTIKESTYRVFN